MDFTKVILRRLRLIKINRNFVVYLMFLAISIVFWFMQAIKEMSEVTLTYQLVIEDLPRNLVYTSEMPSEVNVIYSSKGWNAFYYKFMKNEEQALVINFKDIAQNAGKLSIDANTLRRAAMKVKPMGMTFKSTTPNRISVFYSNGQHKRVPVIFNGHVTTTDGRFQCGTILTPDSVDLYAPEHLYGSITSIKTENMTFEELQDTLTTKLALLVPHGAKVIPDSIEACICVDIFTDKTIQVPVYSENVPTNKIMRTFPQKVEVTFLVSSTLYDDITPQDFLIAIDYKEALSGTSRCKLHLRQTPENIRHLRMPESVEYIIEQTAE
ncbi:MAG: hypothetical protein K2J84_06610 [Bacteroidaceae bacterium]|nr:hypothetical protein [Bacteroidaceae bacterium]